MSGRWHLIAAGAGMILVMGVSAAEPRGLTPAIPRIASGDTAEATPLGIDELLGSVDRTFPLLEAARREQDEARAAQLEAQGAFDLKVKAEGETQRGYYDNTRFKSALEQPLAPLGLTLFGGYRVGEGTFAPYDEKALTLDEGEFSAGFSLPLLRDRSVDARRTGLRVTGVGVDLAARGMEKTRLSAFKDALKQYWDWVAAAQQLNVARALLDLAERRDGDLATAVQLGQIAPVERTDNRRVILQRRSALITARRVVEATGIGLSMFYRAADGSPLRPDVARAPKGLPEPRPLTAEEEARAIEVAIERRPEVQSLTLKVRQQQFETRLAGNALLPSLNLFGDVARDAGDGRSSRKGTDLEAGVWFELPLQRRKASGKLGQARAKEARITQDLRFAQDRVRADVQDAASALRATYAAVDVVRQELAIARELESLERDRFQLGDSTQFLVNLRELNTADAAFREIKALADYHKAWTEFEAATGQLLDRPTSP